MSSISGSNRLRSLISYQFIYTKFFTLPKQEIQLSSDLTRTIAILSLTVAIIADIIFIGNLSGLKELILASLVIVALNILFISHFYYSSEAFIKGRTLKLKKIFRKTEELQIDSILKISSFALRTSKYTILKYEIEGVVQHALILNANSILLEKECCAADILKAAQKL